MVPLIEDFYKAIMVIGSFVCHQQPDRSPYLGNLQMPFCWRCSGLFFGTVLLLSWLMLKRELPSLPLSIVLGSLMPLDLLFYATGFWGGHNVVRMITGLLWAVFGVSIGLHFLGRKGLRSAWPLRFRVVERSQLRGR